jgi:hypothetical protein
MTLPVRQKSLSFLSRIAGQVPRRFRFELVPHRDAFLQTTHLILETPHESQLNLFLPSILPKVVWFGSSVTLISTLGD